MHSDPAIRLYFPEGHTIQVLLFEKYSPDVHLRRLNDMFMLEYEPCEVKSPTTFKEIGFSGSPVIVISVKLNIPNEACNFVVPETKNF